MKLILILFITLLLTTPCFAEQWFCVKDQALIYIYDETPDKCKSYSSLRLKKPIVSRSNKKFKGIVETFDDRRAISNCSYNSIY